MEAGIAFAVPALVFFGGCLGAYLIARAPRDSMLGDYREHVASYGLVGFLFAGVFGGALLGAVSVAFAGLIAYLL